MAVIRPFRAIRPAENMAAEVAALPYDVYNREEACAEVKDHPYSFLNIDRPETQFDASVDTYDPRVYEKADEMIRDWVNQGIFIQEQAPAYYVYALTMNGRTQTGLVACSSASDYVSGVIAKHENTRADKELDRINHVDRTSCQTGPIFLAYRDSEEVNGIIGSVTAEKPLYDFVSEDGVRHTVWGIFDSERMERLTKLFSEMDHTYIADGHHRAASAVKVALKRRENGFRGDEEFNFFLSVLFPKNELKILDYNRVVKDLNGFTDAEFLQKVSEAGFTVEEISEEGTPKSPERKGQVTMLLSGVWYLLTMNPEIVSDDPVKGLDVSILQDRLLSPVLGISDPKTDSRIDFIGGIRGLSELERRVHTDMKVAFSMYPTQMEELFRVADAGLLMPPKSTWFEPKLRSGLFIHSFER